MMHPEMRRSVCVRSHITHPNVTRNTELEHQTGTTNAPPRNPSVRDEDREAALRTSSHFRTRAKIFGKTGVLAMEHGRVRQGSICLSGGDFQTEFFDLVKIF